MAIGKSLEIGEGSAPNIFYYMEEQQDSKIPAGVSNPHRLTLEDVMELADFNIQLWMELKENIRRHGFTNPKIFNQEAIR